MYKRQIHQKRQYPKRAKGTPPTKNQDVADMRTQESGQPAHKKVFPRSHQQYIAQPGKKQGGYHDSVPPNGPTIQPHHKDQAGYQQGFGQSSGQRHVGEQARHVDGKEYSNGQAWFAHEGEL